MLKELAYILAKVESITCTVSTRLREWPKIVPKDFYFFSVLVCKNGSSEMHLKLQDDRLGYFVHLEGFSFANSKQMMVL